MKIKGRKISKPNLEIIVIPRGGEEEDIVFKAQAVLDMSDFDKMCPMPKPPVLVKKGGMKVVNIEDPIYKQELERHGKLRITWMVLQSLRATEDFEWETVDPQNPDTWNNYEREFKESGFSQVEVNRIISGVMTANSLNDDRIKEARERFFAGQEGQSNGSSSLPVAPSSMPSGEPASGSA